LGANHATYLAVIVPLLIYQQSILRAQNNML